MINEESFKPRNFEEDLKNSNDPKIRIAWERLLKLKFGQEIKIIWKEELNVQTGLGLDVTIETKKGRRYSIELKTRNHRVYQRDWIMEIVHHRYSREEKPRDYLGNKSGWLYITNAEYIFHATLNESKTDFLEAIFYSIHPFKDDIYKSEFNQYPVWFMGSNLSGGIYQLTINKLIPKEIISRDANEFWEWKNGN